MSNQTKIVSKKAPMDWERLSDTFKDAYLKLCQDNDIGITDIDCNIDQNDVLSAVQVEVKVYGLAGAPSRDQMHNKATGKMKKEAKSVVFAYGNHDLTFELVDSYAINANDYSLFYKLKA